MTTLKFDKSVKYNGVRYAAHQVFQANDEDVEDLKTAGATILSAPATDTPPAPDAEGGEEQKEEEGTDNDQEQTSDDDQEQPAVEDVAQLKEKLLEYTVPELIQFAEERGIDLQKKTKKAEIYNIIVATLE